MWLNPGNEMFQESLNSQIYVDKSGLIAYLNSVASTSQKYVCVSRPRRFGKSMTANMLVAYYSRACDSRSQFAGLAIGRDPTFERGLNRHDVVHLNMQDFLSASSGVDDMLGYIEESVGDELAAAFPQAARPRRGGLAAQLAAVYARTGV